MTKKFLVQVQCDERTRMLCTDEAMREYVELMLSNLFTVWTNGSRPTVQARLVVEPPPPVPGSK